MSNEHWMCAKCGSRKRVYDYEADLLHQLDIIWVNGDKIEDFLAIVNPKATFGCKTMSSSVAAATQVNSYVSSFGYFTIRTSEKVPENCVVMVKR